MHFVYMCVCVCMLMLHKPLKTIKREAYFPVPLPNYLKSFLKHLKKSWEAKRHPKQHFLRCFNFRNITTRNGVLFAA